MPRVQSLKAAERETIVTTSDADELVHVWTAQRRVITKLRKSPLFTETDQGHIGGTEWAEFTVPADRWTPAGVRHIRSMTTEQRKQAAARVSGIRQSPVGQEAPSS